MPTLRETARKILDEEALAKKDGQEGYYPMMFKNDWVKIKFTIALRWELWKRKVKAKCHR